MSKKKNLIGKRFGRLVVIKDSLKRQSSHVLWECLCDCGKRTFVTSSHLLSGAVRSCGCYKVDTNKILLTTHGLSSSRLFKIWSGMLARCKTQTQSGYIYYGGRGISVCKEWDENFTTFKEWALNNGYNNKMSIERIDVNGNYCPENCKWIPISEQCNNTRQSHYLTIDGKTLTIKQWANLYGISDNMIRSRLNYGWSEKDAVLKPKYWRKRHYEKKGLLCSK